VPDGPWCRRVRVCSISRQEANLSPMASGGADPPRFAPPHDMGADARRTADGSAPAATTPPLPHDASGLPDPAAAAPASGGSGASLGNTSRRAVQSAGADLTTLVRTLAASVPRASRRRDNTARPNLDVADVDRQWTPAH